MFGFIFGTACLVGLIVVLRRGRHGRRWFRRHGHYGHGYHGCGRHHGHHGWEGHDGWDDDGDYGHPPFDRYDDEPPRQRRRRMRQRGPWGMLYGVFERLETTPGQEKAIKEALRGVWDTGKGMKKQLEEQRGDVARAVSGERFEEELLGDLFSRQDDQLREMQKAFAGALAKIHDALDDVQRKRLGEMLESRGMRWGFGGPYR